MGDMEALFRAAFRDAPNALILTEAVADDGNPRIVACNPAFTELTGYTEQDVVGREAVMLVSLGEASALDGIEEPLAAGESVLRTSRLRRKDGSEYLAEWQVTPVHAAGDVASHLLIAHRDVTAEQQERRFRDTIVAALDHADDAILITDDRDLLLFGNSAFERISGYPVAEATGVSLRALLEAERVEWSTLMPDRREPEVLDHKVRAFFRIRCKDGSTAYIDVSTVEVRDDEGAVTRRVSGWKDMTRVAARGREILVQAATDELTGLLNRHAGAERLEEALDDASVDRPFAVVMADVDNFKAVNDTYGHPVGDRVLADVARRMRSQVRSDDSVIRWGGDEFLVLLPGASEDPAAWLAERLRTVVEATADPDAGPIRMSFGVAQWLPGESTAEVVDRADAALYTAKSTGGGRVQLAASRVHH
jgi:diguanylate cyclase (GGDEF)-like protein/PAS domain S-box-containing protein